VLAEHGIGVIDLLVVNLYPFEATTARPDCTDAEAVENIDVGGPAMVRAAAKNHEHILVVVDPADYAPVLAALEEGNVPTSLRRELAIKAFSHTSRYDAAISSYLRTHSAEPEAWPDPLLRGWRLAQALRYGENPHQHAALYRAAEHVPGTVAHATTVQGKELSFNNLVDADAAYQAVKAFELQPRDREARESVRSSRRRNTLRGLSARVSHGSYVGVRRCDRIQPSARSSLGRSHPRAAVRRGHRRTRNHEGCPYGAREKPAIRVLETGWPPASADLPMKRYWLVFLVLLVPMFHSTGTVGKKPSFKVLASTPRSGTDHVLFAEGALKFFSDLAAKSNIVFDYTTDWDDLNDSNLAKYQVVVWLNSAPSQAGQKRAFQNIWKTAAHG